MIAKALESWKGCFEVGDEFEVLAEHNQYILIKEDSGRLVWNYFKLFEITGTFEQKQKYEFKIHWDIV